MQSHLSHILPHTTFSTRNKRCARTWAMHVSRTKTCATPSPREDKWRQTCNRLHTSAPVIRSRAGPRGADRADDHLVFTSEPSAQREPPSHFLRLTEAVSHVLNLLQHVGVTCPRVSTCLTLPCSCLKRRCCVSKLRQLCTPLGQLLTCPARSFGSDLYVTNSHRTSTISGRSSASAGTLAQHTSMLAAKQDKDAGFCIVFHTSFMFAHFSSLFQTSWSFYFQLGNFHPSLPALRMCLPTLRFVLTPLFSLDRFER